MYHHERQQKSRRVQQFSLTCNHYLFKKKLLFLSLTICDFVKRSYVYGNVKKAECFLYLDKKKILKLNFSKNQKKLGQMREIEQVRERDKSHWEGGLIIIEVLIMMNYQLKNDNYFAHGKLFVKKPC